MDNLVVPTIFSEDVETFKKKVDILKSFCSYVHIDVCDGRFVPTKTVSLSNLSEYFLSSSMNCEFHLMVNEPLNYIDLLRSFSAKIVYVQVEIFKRVDELKRVVKEYSLIGCRVGLVFNPSTLIEDFVSYLSLVDYVMLMSVYPGAEGQSFEAGVLRKVCDIKVLKPKMIVQIDGGITRDTGKLALDSGVDRLAVGSYITSSETPQKNYIKLLQLLK